VAIPAINLSRCTEDCIAYARTPNVVVGHESPRDPEPRMTVLARASRNLPDRPTPSEQLMQ
jgi:hypothetical protein